MCTGSIVGPFVFLAVVLAFLGAAALLLLYLDGYWTVERAKLREDLKHYKRVLRGQQKLQDVDRKGFNMRNYRMATWEDD